MIKNTRIKEIQGSITLGLVFGLGLLSLTLASIALSSVTNTIGSHRNELSGLRTFVTADSAAREGVYRYLQESNYSGDVDWVDLAGGGEINAVLASSISIDKSNWPNILVRGSAENSLTGREVGYTVRPSDLELAFDHAIYSQFDLEIGGNATVNGSIYANGDIDFTGGSAEVNGDAFAVGDIDQSHDNIDDETHLIVRGTETLAPPTIDSAVYYSQAVADGTWYNAPVLAETAHNGVTTNNVVVYVEGASHDTHLVNSNTKISGTVFVEGDLSLKSITITPGDDIQHDDPLVVYVGGNLHLGGNTSIYGLVYVMGATTFSGGNNTITGSLISANSVSQVDVTGNITVNYDPVLMSEWRDIEGLSFATGIDDVTSITDWTEL